MRTRVLPVDCQKILHWAIQHTRFLFFKMLCAKRPTHARTLSENFTCRFYAHTPCFLLHYAHSKLLIRLGCQHFLQPAHGMAAMDTSQAACTHSCVPSEKSLSIPDRHCVT